MLNAETLYLEHEQEVRDLARKFHHRHGGELDELEGEARYWFMVAVRQRPEEMFTSGWKWKRVIWINMVEKARTIARRNARLARVGIDMARLYARPDFDVKKFIEDLPPDAKAVCRIAINPPKDVVWNARDKRGGENSPVAMRSAITEFLREIGWAAARIAESFNEIAEALRS